MHNDKSFTQHVSSISMRNCNSVRNPIGALVPLSVSRESEKNESAMRVSGISARTFRVTSNAVNSRVSSAMVLLLSALLACCFQAAAQTPLATLNYKIVGTYLRVSPAAVAVPKGIAGSVLVELANSDGSDKSPDNAITQGAYIEATLRGPSFPTRRLIGEVNKPLLLPVLNLVGDYQLDNIRLVDSITSAVRMEGTPGSVPVRVFEEVLVSTVTSRPLTLAEIQERGIVIDDQNF